MSGTLEAGNTFKARIKYAMPVLKDDRAFNFDPEIDELPVEWDITIDCPIRLKR